SGKTLPSNGSMPGNSERTQLNSFLNHKSSAPPTSLPLTIPLYLSAHQSSPRHSPLSTRSSAVPSPFPFINPPPYLPIPPL
ncbi:MAG TPA: hypothetical protein VL832_08390, partial [Puia sp.]|nr:hypothetical protein [Puia sp.]